MLNQRLLLANGITKATEKRIKNLHILLSDVLSHPHRYKHPVKRIEEVEYKLQQLWKLPKNPNYHRHWLNIKGCTCPYHDNIDVLGTGFKAFDTECKWHGNMRK